jgi:hypothetical protein
VIHQINQVMVLTVVEVNIKKEAPLDIFVKNREEVEPNRPLTAWYQNLGLDGCRLVCIFVA